MGGRWELTKTSVNKDITKKMTYRLIEKQFWKTDFEFRYHASVGNADSSSHGLLNENPRSDTEHHLVNCWSRNSQRPNKICRLQPLSLVAHQNWTLRSCGWRHHVSWLQTIEKPRCNRLLRLSLWSLYSGYKGNHEKKASCGIAISEHDSVNLPGKVITRP